MERYSRRRSAVLADLGGAGDVDVLLVTGAANVRYLTGFSGSNGWLLLAPDAAVLLTDPRYAAQASDEVEGLDVIVSSTALHEALAEAVPRCGGEPGRLGFEAEQVSVALRDKLRNAIGDRLVPTRSLVEDLRRCKDADEIAAIRAALAIVEAVLPEVVEGLAVGDTEVQIAADLEHACRRRGAAGMAFETIVASGPRSALPHGVAGDRPAEAGEPLMIDIGCRRAGYCSDLTRMVWLGDAPDARWLEVCGVVDRARAAALAALAPGVAVAEVDAAARRVIDDAGYGEAFRHGTGHGVGLEVHEAPKLSATSDDVLEEGMVVTVEPGVYLEGEFGVRIEDMVCITAEGYERLTTLGTEPILRGFARAGR